MANITWLPGIIGAFAAIVDNVPLVAGCGNVSRGSRW